MLGIMDGRAAAAGLGVGADLKDSAINEKTTPGRPIRFWLAMLAFGCVVPMLLLALALMFFQVDRHRVAVLDQARDTARALTLVVDRELDVRTATLIVLSGSQSLAIGDLVRFRQSAIAAVARTSPENEVLLADTTGHVILSTARGGISAQQIPTETEFERALETGKPHVSNLFVDKESGAYVYGISVPVPIDGVIKYVLVKKLRVDAMTRILSQQKLPEDWFAGVFDRTSTVVGRNKNANRFIGKHASRGLYEGMKGGPEGTVESETLEGVGVFSNWSRSPTSGWSVAVAVPRRIFTVLLFEDLALFGTLALAMLAVSVGIAWLVGDRIALPMRGVAQAAKSLAAGAPAIPRSSAILEVAEIQEALSRTSVQLDENRKAREMVVSDLRAADERQRVLIAELDHRAKNMLATVQSIARRTLPQGDPRVLLEGRLLALSRAHSALAATGWRGASLRKLLSAEGEAFGEHFVLNGPDLLLNPKTAQALSLIVHELTTNAAKYGALSVPDGIVHITWQIETEGELYLRFVWAETGGPPVAKPERVGFGRTLIERSATHDLDGSVALDFRPEGVVCTLVLPMSDMALTPLPVPAPERPQVQPVARRMPARKRLLVCEDEALVALDIADAFEAAGYEIVGPAGRMGEALKLARESEIDGAVLDVNLNGEMIFPVAEVLRSRGIPFVFSTGYGDQANFPSEFRIVPCVSKPFDRAGLVATVDALFRDAEATAR
jgi:two-component sensor histidine kinase/CheY-like chemotaxis protein